MQITIEFHDVNTTVCASLSALVLQNRWQYNPAALDVTTPVVPWAHAYDAVCEGADWVRNHEARYVDIASVQVSLCCCLRCMSAMKGCWTDPEHLFTRRDSFRSLQAHQLGPAFNGGCNAHVVQVWPDDWMQAPEPWKLHWSRQWVRLAICINIQEMTLQILPVPTDFAIASPRNLHRGGALPPWEQGQA